MAMTLREWYWTNKEYISGDGMMLILCDNNTFCFSADEMAEVLKADLLGIANFSVASISIKTNNKYIVSLAENTSPKRAKVRKRT